MGRIIEVDILVIIVRERAYFSNNLKVILQSRSYGISLDIDNRCWKMVKSLTMMKILKEEKQIEGIFAWDNLGLTGSTDWTFPGSSSSSGIWIEANLWQRKDTPFFSYLPKYGASIEIHAHRRGLFK